MEMQTEEDIRSAATMGIHGTAWYSMGLYGTTNTVKREPCKGEGSTQKSKGEVHGVPPINENTVAPTATSQNFDQNGNGRFLRLSSFNTEETLYSFRNSVAIRVGNPSCCAKEENGETKSHLSHSDARRH